MPRREYQIDTYMPHIGCLLVLGTLLFLCVLPMLFIDVMNTTLEKLHLPPVLAALVVAGILLGGLVNLPVSRFEREEEQLAPRGGMYGLMGWVPVVRRQRTQTILAVNVGGCVIPLLVAAYEALLLLTIQPPARDYVLMALAASMTVNVVVCYLIARPIPGVGIAMPAFASPAIAVGMVWLLLLPPEYALVRAPVAFIAGVTGPLVGADLLHLRDFTKVSAGVISIGGAGTFDGIVLSSMLAAFLA